MRTGKGIGVAPAILIGAGSLITSGLYQAEESYQSGFLNNLFQALGMKDTPSLPAAMPSLRPPAAPKTEYGMVHWSPEWQNEALHQRQDQFYADQAAWTAAARESEDKKSSLFPIAVVAIVVVGAALLVKR